jgi:predicted RNA binding protein YcfA (HicA-like mRNA interferase family)
VYEEGVVSGRLEVKKLVRALRQAGWTVTLAGSGHWIASAPDGRRLMLASTPGKAGLAKDWAKLHKALCCDDVER